MKNFTCYLLLLAAIGFTSCRNETPVVSANPDDVAAAVDVFIKGVVDADESVLKSITAEDLIYAHSNGRVQNKTDFIAEVLNPGSLNFVKAELKDQTVKVVGETAVVRHIITLDTMRNNGPQGPLVLGNMLVWQNQNGQWKLLARQAYRLPGR